MPTDRKKKIIAEALAAEEEYQVCTSVKCRPHLCTMCTVIANTARGELVNWLSLCCKE